jgi:hypothetical protein
VGRLASWKAVAIRRAVIALVVAIVGCEVMFGLASVFVGGRPALDDRDLDAQFAYGDAADSLLELRRIRRDLSDAGARAARRDQLLVMTTGLSEMEAEELLRAFAAKRPLASKSNWMVASYCWIGRTAERKWTLPRLVQGVSGWNARPNDSVLAEMYDQGTQAAESDPSVSPMRYPALSEWLWEARQGLVDPPPKNFWEHMRSPAKVGVDVIEWGDGDVAPSEGSASDTE